MSNTCAVKGCIRKEYKVTIEPGRFNTLVVIPFCKVHWQEELVYQKKLKKWELENPTK